VHKGHAIGEPWPIMTCWRILRLAILMDFAAENVIYSKMMSMGEAAKSP
jgi:hypothetical protein